MSITKYFLKTFGCQMNHSDSERLDAVLENINLKKVETIEESDLVIFNTCSIKQHAEDRVFGFVRNAKDEGKIVGITGCMVKKSSTRKTQREEQDPLVKKFDKIDLVFRIEDIKNVPELLQDFDSNITRASEKFDELDYLNITPKLQEKFRAFVPIMTGCDKFCTYCVVPFTRGKERSRKFSDIITECTKHVENGAKEITLVGQNVNAYFLDDTDRKTLQRQTDFSILLDAVAQIPNLTRLKFTSPHPRHMGEDVLEVMAAHKNIAKTLHLPVQTGSSKVLQRMGREHNIARFTDITKKARELMPNITFTTDIIVGFCDETQAEFEKTMELFDQQQFLMAFISKYSTRKGTFAGDKMIDSISDTIKKQRFKTLTEKLAQTALSENTKTIGTIEEVLVEKVLDGIATGHTHTGRSCRFPVGSKGDRFIGEIIAVKILKASSWSVEGEMM